MNNNLPVLKGRYSSLGAQSDLQVGILLSKSKPKISINNFEENNNSNNNNNDNIFSNKVSPEKAELKAKTIKITQMSHNADVQNAYENTTKSLKIITSPIRKLPSRNNNNNNGSGYSISKTKASLKHGTFSRSFCQSYDLNGTNPNPDTQGARIAQAIVPSARSTPLSSPSRSGTSSYSSNNNNGNSNTGNSNTNTATFSYMRSARRVRTSHGYTSASSSLYGNNNNNSSIHDNQPPPSPSKPSQSDIEVWKAAAQDRLAKSTEKLKQQKLRDKTLSESSSGRRGENYSEKNNATQRKRAEIYAINAILKKAEQEKYKAYCNSHAPLDTDDDDNDDGTDSDDSGSNGYDDTSNTSTPTASPMRNPSSSPAPSPFRMNVNVHL